MRIFNLIVSVIICICFTSVNVRGQEWIAGENITLNISAYSLIESNYAPVNLSMETSAAGLPIQEVSNSDVFIKLSSIVPGGTDRELTARISTGSVPLGTYLTLVSAECTATNSGGELGTANSTPIVLNSVDQLITQYIGTCYTGTGYNDGYQMTFTWALNPASNYSQISSVTNNITVAFTLTAHDGN